MTHEPRRVFSKGIKKMAMERRDAAHREQLSLFDSPVVVSAPKVSEQKRQLERVKVSIADVIIEFFRLRRVGDRFFASELHAFVRDHAQIAPASADRVMRDLRKSGQVNYCVISRSRSEYRVESV